MQPQDANKFKTVMQDTFSYYEKEMTDTLLTIYWQGLQAYSLYDITRALEMHIKHPEDGIWMPKVAQLTKYCSGGSTDNAVVAWNKVDSAIRRVGTYQNVVFDDPLIHKILAQLGGWVTLCNTQSDRDLEFKGIEFKKLYKSLYNTVDTFDEIPALSGLVDQENRLSGSSARGQSRTVYIGDKARCEINSTKLVMLPGLISYAKHVINTDQVEAKALSHDEVPDMKTALQTLVSKQRFGSAS